MTRKEFLEKSAKALGAIAIGKIATTNSKLFSKSVANYPDLVAVRSGEPEEMFDIGIKAIGGIERFVKKGQTVVVKPNIGWDKKPEEGANTNPKLVKRIIEACYQAGAKRVYVFDNTCDYWENCYKNSGIKEAAESVGGVVVSGDEERDYKLVNIKGAKLIPTAKVHRLVVDSDVFINVPVLKHHGGGRVTAAMKNLMGCVWDRRAYHSKGLHQAIAEFCLYKKPDLNIIDAYRMMTKHGPRGISLNDIAILKNQFLSTDIAAIDVAAIRTFGLEPTSVEYINFAKEFNIGQTDLSKLNIARLSTEASS